ncbi:MAG TPA: fused MFS/spermidine synthase [Gemmatimonadaceae bacterium]|nr:fused MFS/spermidine synthase [Gemmatimonadaceae bacterium]
MDQRHDAHGAPGTDTEPAARGMALFLYAIFVLSGAAGLIYESIWSRYLGLFVGHSAYAQVIVLVIFLGGMAGGALFAGRRSERIRQPLLWYAGVEIVVGVMGLVFHDLFGAVTGAAYDRILPAFVDSAMLVPVKWMLAGLLILPQSILLGTTFPLMSAGALRVLARPEEPDAHSGRVLSLLYFANSLGAAAGVLIAGFYLIRIVGLPGTLLVAALINIVVGALVFAVVRLEQLAEDEVEERGVLARRERPMAQVPVVQVPVVAEPALPSIEALPAPLPGGGGHAADERPRLWRLLLVVSFGTAVASFIYEIAWIRMLSFVLGSATHSFELMLSAFILGLALGSFWIRSRIDRLRHPLATLGLVQVAMGLLAVATLPLYLASFEWTATLLGSLRPSEGGYRLFNIARYGMSLAVMLPSTFCAGMTLPLITAMLLRSGMGERAIGTVYGVNTFGSIVGVVLAALVLMPVLGLKRLLFAGAMLDISLGIVLLAVWRRRQAATTAHRGLHGLRQRVWRLGPASVAARAAVVLAVFAFASRFDRAVLTSGVYRFGTIAGRDAYDIVFYRDGRTATVSVRTGRTAGGIHLATNGKPDASLSPDWFQRDSLDALVPLRGDASTQAFLGIVSMAHAPDARSAAVIGQGSGMTSHMLLANPALERVVTIEIEPEMVDGSRLFRPFNDRVFDDPRSSIVIDDAKSYFAAGRNRYDLIISEPSNPWVSGVSGLFTAEFYDRVKRYLTEDGVFGQWLHLYEIDDGLVLSVLAALHEHFPAYDVYLVARTDLLIVATTADTLPAPDWNVLQLAGIRDDLRHILPIRGAHMDAMHLASRATFGPLLDTWGTRNSDYFPVLDLGTERTRFERLEAEGFTGLQDRRFDPVAALEGRRIGFVEDPQSPVVAMPRLQGLALAARLRATQGTADSLPDDPAYDEAMYRVGQFRATLRGNSTPTSWRHWVRELLDIETRLHGGTAGAVDDAFYREVFAYLERVRAPHEAVTTARFMRALAAWDFADASFQADVLAETRVWSEVWLPIDYLRDGMVTAKLLTGDVEGARLRYDALAAAVRPRDELLSLILHGQIARAEAQDPP